MGLMWLKLAENPELSLFIMQDDSVFFEQLLALNEGRAVGWMIKESLINFWRGKFSVVFIESRKFPGEPSFRPAQSILRVNWLCREANQLSLFSVRICQMQDIPLHDNVFFTRDSNKGVSCHIAFYCFVFSLESIHLQRPVQIIVCALCSTRYLYVSMVFGEQMFASGCWEGCSVERRWLLQDLHVCVASPVKYTRERDVSLAHCFQ